MTYIPSRYTYEQVLELLDAEKAKSNENLKNYRYLGLFLWQQANNIGAVAFALFILYQFAVNHATYLFPWAKAVEHYGPSGQSVAVILYLVFWIVLINLIHKLLSGLQNQVHKFYVKRGFLIPNKYAGHTGEEINIVYKNMQQFIDYIAQNPELTEKDFQINETGVLLVRTIHYIDGDEKISFYLGPHLKEIIIEHTVLDFSKFDTFYRLTEEIA